MQILNDKIEGLTFKYFKSDIPSGLVVFLVALPLCLALRWHQELPYFPEL
jgi:MFS superfamily sulfate permease-like transporter